MLTINKANTWFLFNAITDIQNRLIDIEYAVGNLEGDLSYIEDTVIDNKDEIEDLIDELGYGYDIYIQ